MAKKPNTPNQFINLLPLDDRKERKALPFGQKTKKLIGAVAVVAGASTLVVTNPTSLRDKQEQTSPEAAPYKIGEVECLQDTILIRPKTNLRTSPEVVEAEPEMGREENLVHVPDDVAIELHNPRQLTDDQGDIWYKGLIQNIEGEKTPFFVNATKNAPNIFYSSVRNNQPTGLVSCSEYSDGSIRGADGQPMATAILSNPNETEQYFQIQLDTKDL